jgi:hypothetical protein
MGIVFPFPLAIKIVVACIVYFRNEIWYYGMYEIDLEQMDGFQKTSGYLSTQMYFTFCVCLWCVDWCVVRLCYLLLQSKCR